VIAGILLAAGASRRFGSQKLLAKVGGIPLVRRTAAELRATSLDEIVVVLGSNAPAVGAALAGLDVRTVTNPDYAAGMSTSLRAGLTALSPMVDAVLVALADQPGVGAEIVGRLLERYQAGRQSIVAPIYRGDVRGNPVLFDRALFGELRAVTGDEGGRSVIARDPERVALVELEMDMPSDVDLPGDIRS
jgi:molybdenum cofactor cytidylyltransferase